MSDGEVEREYSERGRERERESIVSEGEGEREYRERGSIERERVRERE